MSDVILYGTLPNGEAVRVEANESGQLVAEGLQGHQGEQGPPGQQGEEGPAGPPGNIYDSLPPDPYEGAFLGWSNDQLAWLGNPVVLPENTIGPITDYNYEDGILTIGAGDNALFVTDRQVFMSDDQGTKLSYSPETDEITRISGSTYFLESDKNLRNGAFQVGELVGSTWDQALVWSNYLTASSGIVETPAGGFDAIDSSAAHADPGVKLIWAPPVDVVITERFEVYGNWQQGGVVTVEIGEKSASVDADGAGWFEFPGFAGSTISTATPMYLVRTGVNRTTSFSAIRLDGVAFVDKGIPGAPGGKIVSISPDSPAITIQDGDYQVGGKIVGTLKSPEAKLHSSASATWPNLKLKDDTGGWRVGDYVTTPETTLAARLVPDLALKEPTDRRLA